MTGCEPPQQPLTPPPGWWARQSRGAKIAIGVAGFLAVGTAASLAGYGEDEDAASGDAPVTTTTASTTTTVVEPPSLPSGFRVSGDVGAGFEIALPERWQQISPDSDDLEDVLAATRESNPQLGATIDQALAGFRQGGVLFAIDLDSPADFKPTLTIVRADGLFDDTGAAVDAAVSALEAAGAEDVAVERVDLPAGDALRITNVLPIQTPGGELRVQNVQYVLAADDTTWAVNLSTGDLAADGDLFDQIVETFRLVG